MILERIRRHNILLITVIGLALLAFIITGIFTKNKGGMPTEIGEVDGEEIPYDSFREQVENTMRGIGQGSDISTSYVVNMLWDNEVQTKIIEKQIEKLGIGVSKEQLLDFVSKSPAIAQDAQFQNEKGEFDKNKFVQFISTLKVSNPDGYRQWQQQEEQIMKNSKRDMYMSLVRAGLGATIAEGEKSYHDETDKVSIKYANLDYSTIADDKIKVSDNEIKDYVNSHKKEFEREMSRDIQFVVLRDVASEQDKKDVLLSLEKLNEKTVVYNQETQKNDTISGFGAVSKENMAEFVNSNSDTPYDSTYVTKDKLPVSVADNLYSLPVGGVYGPFLDGDTYKIVKMVGKDGKAQVRASHILLSYKDAPNIVNSASRTKEEAKAKAEEILAKVKSGSDFGTLANENSDDKTPNGDLNFFSKGQMVKAFEDFAFSHAVGETGIVETQFGFHVIKVTEQKEGVRLATISRKIEPSDKTRQDIFSKISNFEVNSSENPSKFAEIAKKEGLEVIPANNLEELSENITGLGNSRQLVKWTYEDGTKVGAVRRFDLKDGYAVAQLLKKNEKGLATVEQVRVIVEPIIKKEKKAKELMAKLKGSNVDQIAGAIGQGSARVADGITMKNPTILGVGYEPKVAGVAFGLKEGKVSAPIMGDNGVYVIEVVTKEVAPALPNYNNYANGLKMMKMSSAQGLLESLKEGVKIKDNRKLFY